CIRDRRRPRRPRRPPTPPRGAGERPRGRAPRRRAGPDLEAIRGIGPERAKDLRRAGIRGVDDFVRADEEKLKEVLGDRDIAGMKKEGRRLLGRRSE
ncbi:MAG: helix-hairpin-helix domain-containing protein, partial [Gemmatimonadota bacterium]